MSEPRWRVIASSYIVDSRFLRLRKDVIELPDGSLVQDYYVRESRGFVVVFALTANRDVVLVRQYKHGIARSLLELPAGAIDPGEEPLQSAVRELEEETGYTAPAMEYLRSFVVDPTNSNTLAHVFLARDARCTSQQHLDRTENIEVSLASLSELRDLVRDGIIDSVSHVAAIYVTLDLLNG